MIYSTKWRESHAKIDKCSDLGANDHTSHQGMF